MATDVVTPMPSGDLSSAIDALPVSVPSETPTDTTTESTSEAPPSLETPNEPEQTPEAATPETPEQQEETPELPEQTPEQEELDPADELAPDKISQDGKTYFFRANKAKALLAARDNWNSIQAKIPNATVDQLAENYQRVVGLDQMLADYDSGDPARVSQAADFFLQSAQNQQSVGVFADHVMAKLASAQPQAFGMIERKVLNGYASKLYQDAIRANDQDLFKLAQNVDFKLTGRFRTPEHFAQRDPFEAERQQFERERADFYSLRQTEQRQLAEQRFQQAQDAVNTAVQEEIGKAVPPNIADAYRKVPGGEQKLALVNLALEKAIEDAKKANPTWLNHYKLVEQRYRDNPSDETKQQLVTMMRQFVAPHVAKARNAAIKAIFGSTMSENAAAHAKQQQIAAKREPTGSNAPVRRGGFDQKLAELKQRGASAQDGLRAIFGEA